MVYGKLVSWPNFGDIEGIKAEFVVIGFVRLHDLHLCSPSRVLSSINGVPQVPLRKVGIFAREARSLIVGKLLLPVIRNEMVFDVDLRNPSLAENLIFRDDQYIQICRLC